MPGDQRQVQRLGRFARRRPALTFVVFTYSLSWSVWGGGYLLLPADLPFIPVVFLGVFGPAVAAALTVRVTGGRVRVVPLQAQMRV